MGTRVLLCDLQLEIKATDALTAEEHAYIASWMRQVWGSTDAANYKWSESDWHIVGRIDGKPVTHVEIVERIGTVNGQPVKLGGIGGVTTLPEWRRCGFASTALQRAATFMREELRVEFGLLICEREMVPLYRRLWWEIADAPLVFEQSSGKTSFPEAVAMVLPCSGKEFPRGVIDLCGLPW